MEPTLEQAMAALCGEVPLAPGGATGPGALGGPEAERPGATTLPGSALDTFRRAREALRQGNWADYGRLQGELEGLLQRLAE